MESARGQNERLTSDRNDWARRFVQAHPVGHQVGRFEGRGAHPARPLGSTRGQVGWLDAHNGQRHVVRERELFGHYTVQ
jgi:hypothetical protein